MNLGEKIRNARIAKHMSQADLASAAGVSLRTIQNYELNARLPRNRDIYRRLAAALDVEENILLDNDMDFVLRVKEQYGNRSASQAWELAADMSAMFAGGDMEEEDMDEIMRALQDAYWEAKKVNRKYVSKRYREEDNS